jgi:hypothetical protein
MSKGSPVVPVRIPAELLAVIDATVSRVNVKTRGEPYTRSSWILAAIRDRLAHMERAKKPRRRAAGPARSEGFRNESNGARPGAVGRDAGNEREGEG